MTASYEKAMFGPRVKTQGQCPRVGRCPRLPPAGRGRGRTLPRSPQKKRPLSHPDPPDHEAIKARCPSRAVWAVSFRTRPPTTAPRGPRGCPTAARSQALWPGRVRVAHHSFLPLASGFPSWGQFLRAESFPAAFRSVSLAQHTGDDAHTLLRETHVQDVYRHGLYLALGH